MSWFSIDDLRKKKQEKGYSLQKLSEITGVPFATIQKILSGTTKNPRYETLLRISAALSDEPGDNAEDVKSSWRSYRETKEGQNMLRESSFIYGSAAEKDPPVDNPFGNKMQGDYTVEDYLNLPDDQRYELIDGVIYLMSSPTKTHQAIAGYLYHVLMTCREQTGKYECMPYIAPLDVQVKKDNKTMVQPDVIICCDPALTAGPRVFGAPEFVAEVLSPSSLAKDRYIKLAKYQDSGVREYWLIDPERKQVVVYLFDCGEHKDEIHLYTFDDPIPVAVSNGECKVRFSDMR